MERQQVLKRHPPGISIDPALTGQGFTQEAFGFFPIRGVERTPNELALMSEDGIVGFVGRVPEEVPADLAELSAALVSSRHNRRTA